MEKRANPKDEFYVGYLPKAPQTHAKASRLAVLAFFVLGLTSLFLIIFNQKVPEGATFEYGQLRGVEGVIYKSPIPHLRIVNGYFSDGQPQTQTLPLIGFAKSGPQQTIAQFERKIKQAVNKPLEQTLVRLSGTFSYRDGKALFELTEEGAALKKIFEDFGEYQASDFAQPAQALNHNQFSGQIVDPKCFFGAMKPGHGKPHRSCAARCISGGIPPVLWTQTEQGESEYYLLADEGGEPLHNKVLDWIGKPVKIEGKAERQGDWLVLYCSPLNGIKPIP